MSNDRMEQRALVYAADSVLAERMTKKSRMIEVYGTEHRNGDGNWVEPSPQVTGMYRTI